ncbi:MAG: hypothetical protein ACLQD8_08810 [Thermoplasmata archaeon]
MPFDPERHARLYYDPSCGPCSLFAGTVEGVAHGRVEPVPFDALRADPDLGDLPVPVRYGAAHLVVGSERRTGPEIVGPLVGMTLGPTAGRLFERFPTLGRPLRWIYLRFWEHRSRHGCSTPVRS